MLNILQWNCRAISSTHDLLIQHLSDTHYDVLALQSLTTSSNKLPVLPGYHYPSFTALNENGGTRAAVYVLQGLNARREIIPTSQIEGHKLAIAVQTNEQDIFILNVYNPKPTRDFNWLSDIPANWIVVGDFNRRDMAWDLDYPTSSEKIAEELNNADVLLLNDGSPTRIPGSLNQNATAIDLTFVSSNIAAKADWEVMNDPLSSDHLPIKITIHLSQTLHSSQPSDALNFEKAAWQGYQAMLAALQTPDFFSSIEQINKELSEQILQAAYQNIPRISKWVGPRGNPWWTTKCKEAAKRNRKLYNTYLLLKKKQAKIDEISNVYTKMKEANVACKKKTIAQPNCVSGHLQPVNNPLI